MPRKKKDLPNSSPKPNRVDLNAAEAPVPVVAPGSVEYGERQRIEAAVQELPMASDADRFRGAVGAAASIAPPPSGGLFRPTERPAEPVTAGLSVGPGRGPEALVGARELRQPTVAEIMGRIADMTGDLTHQILAERARRMGV